MKRSYDKTTGKVKFTYDEARTPYQRIIEHPEVDEKIKIKLKEEYVRLNPAKLQREINKLVNKLMATIPKDDSKDTNLGVHS